jgi:hypothetical protein
MCDLVVIALFRWVWRWLGAWVSEGGEWGVGLGDVGVSSEVGWALAVGGSKVNGTSTFMKGKLMHPNQNGRQKEAIHQCSVCGAHGSPR